MRNILCLTMLLLLLGASGAWASGAADSTRVVPPEERQIAQAILAWADTTDTKPKPVYYHGGQLVVMRPVVDAIDKVVSYPLGDDEPPEEARGKLLEIGEAIVTDALHFCATIGYVDATRISKSVTFTQHRILNKGLARDRAETAANIIGDGAVALNDVIVGPDEYQPLQRGVIVIRGHWVPTPIAAAQAAVDDTTWQPVLEDHEARLRRLEGQKPGDCCRMVQLGVYGGYAYLDVTNAGIWQTPLAGAELVLGDRFALFAQGGRNFAKNSSQEDQLNQVGARFRIWKSLNLWASFVDGRILAGDTYGWGDKYLVRATGGMAGPSLNPQFGHWLGGRFTLNISAGLGGFDVEDHTDPTGRVTRSTELGWGGSAAIGWRY